MRTVIVVLALVALCVTALRAEEIALDGGLLPGGALLQESGPDRVTADFSALQNGQTVTIAVPIVERPVEDLSTPSNIRPGMFAPPPPPPSDLPVGLVKFAERMKKLSKWFSPRIYIPGRSFDIIIHPQINLPGR